MFDEFRICRYFKKAQLLIDKGIVEKAIVPFDDELYEKLSHTYVSCLPVSIRIKYLMPVNGLGKCFDRSEDMFLSLDDCVLVRGDIKNLEYKYGTENKRHGWIEMGGYVYDPSSLLRFEKDLYYKIYLPTNISKIDKKACKEYKYYQDIENTTIDDFKPNGKYRLDLMAIIPLIEKIAELSDNLDFKKEVNDFINQIEYDSEQINEEATEKFKQFKNHK